jgi:hypothetical protein
MTDANGNGTVPAPVVRSKGGQFVKGHGRIGGRKVGSRNKLSESFLADLHKAWLRHGKKVLDKVAESAPETFLRVVGQVLPRVMEFDGLMNVQHHSTVHVEARDFMEAYQRWGQAIGARPPMIEAQAEVIEDDGDPDEQPA